MCKGNRGKLICTLLLSLALLTGCTQSEEEEKSSFRVYTVVRTHKGKKTKFFNIRYFEEGCFFCIFSQSFKLTTDRGDVTVPEDFQGISKVKILSAKTRRELWDEVIKQHRTSRKSPTRQRDLLGDLHKAKPGIRMRLIYASGRVIESIHEDDPSDYFLEGDTEFGEMKVPISKVVSIKRKVRAVYIGKNRKASASEKGVSMLGIYDMIWFIKMTPIYMVLMFLTTFTVTKLAQSEKVYKLVSTTLTESRHRKRRRIMREMHTDIGLFLAGRNPKRLKPEERQVYEAMLESYYDELGSLYRKGESNGGE